MMDTKSRILDLRTFFRKTKTAISIIFNDCITLYSAHASFYIIISTIPFIILLLSLAKYVIDIDSVITFIEYRIDGELGNIIKALLADAVGKTGIPLVSLTAVSTLWSSSRGVNSIFRGISEIYGIKPQGNFLYDVFRSIVYTLAFVAIMMLTLIALVFGRTIAIALKTTAPLIYSIFDLVDTYSEVFFFIVLTFFFALIYNTCAKKGRKLLLENPEEYALKVPCGFWAQMPGAAFSALGWLLFSYIYSLYIAFVPNASYIYGSIAAVVFLMLWIYFCMNILMLGAELNKFILIIKNQLKGRKK